MKKINVILASVCLVWLGACSQQESIAPQTTALTTDKPMAEARGGRPDWDVFTHVPQTIRDQAKTAWRGRELPAVTLAFSFNGRTLQEGWKSRVYLRDVSCGVPDYAPPFPDPRFFPDLLTENGFVFLDEGALCRYGDYFVETTEGGWFDYVCGNGDAGFTYSGDPVFVYLHMWCE